jgi:hypothetical protein
MRIQGWANLAGEFLASGWEVIVVYPTCTCDYCPMYAAQLEEWLQKLGLSLLQFNHSTEILGRALLEVERGAA